MSKNASVISKKAYLTNATTDSFDSSDKSFLRFSELLAYLKKRQNIRIMSRFGRFMDGSSREREGT
jgi:hypothetical protein